jgi:hypothetical protein
MSTGAVRPRACVFKFRLWSLDTFVEDSQACRLDCSGTEAYLEMTLL